MPGEIETVATGAIGLLPSSVGTTASSVQKTVGSPLEALYKTLFPVAKSSGSQAKDAQGNSISIAAAIGVDIDNASVQAYVPAAVGIKAAGGLGITTVANTDGHSAADASAVATSAPATTSSAPATTSSGGSAGGGTSSSSPGGAAVGAAVSITLIDSTNEATLGAATQASGATATNVTGGTSAGVYKVGSLTLSALQSNLLLSEAALAGQVVATPVVPGQPLPTSYPAGLNWVDGFGASASSGAGGASIGVAGALAVAVIGSDSVAEVTGKADVIVTPVAGATVPYAGDGSVTLLADNASTSTVAALPVGTSSGSRIGVGASLAFTLLGTQSLAEIDDGATIAGGNANDAGVSAVTPIQPSAAG